VPFKAGEIIDNNTAADRYGPALKQNLRNAGVREERGCNFNITSSVWLKIHRNKRRLVLFNRFFNPDIDIDNFKSINDRCGHLSGDSVLKQFAESLENNVRVNDLVCRYGGEEFVVALLETSVSGAIIVAERIRRFIESTHFFGANAKIPQYLTVSIGVAAWTPQDGAVELKALIEKADHAMYRAKKTGKNCISVSEPGEIIPRKVLQFEK